MTIHDVKAATTSRAALPRRRDEARALFRNAIIEAAEEVFAERGFHAARIADIAARARIAVGTVYNHFEQKEDVLHALLDERSEALLAELTPDPNDPIEFEGALTARVRRVLAYIAEHRTFFAIAFEYGLVSDGTAAADAQLRGRHVRKMARFRAAFRAVLEEGVRAGAIEEANLDRLAAIFGGILRGVMMHALHDDDVAATLADDAPLVTRIFLHGAARRPKKTR